MAHRNRKRRERRRQMLLYRHLLDRENPLESMSEENVFRRFRFRPVTIMFIVSLVADTVCRSTRRSCPLPPLTQVLVSLRFFATGAFTSLIADSYATISTTSVFRSIRDFCTRICSIASRFINMPVDQDRCKANFYKIAGFPNVLGCIDGTFIKIIAPTQNEADYVNRKGFHSLNVQMICDYNFRITNCVAKWPGSVHDSRIFRDSRISLAFNDGTYKGFLLGDSGYPCKAYLMTPFLSPSTRSEERFNNRHARTRVLIEQTFGILKRRFSCLHSGLRTSPEKACKIITTCAVLHNIGIDMHDIINFSDDDNFDINDNINVQVSDDWSGTNVRNYLCQNFFQ